MPDKIKATLKEIQEIYDIEDIEHIPEKKQSDKNSEFEIYTEQYDEKELKELVE